MTLKYLLSLMLLITTLFAADVGAQPVEGYRLVWSDEFDGDKLDFDKWGYRALGPRRDAINVKETVTLDDKGHLVLTTKR
ncbi:MAG: hypothetical protein ACYSWQ_29095, partial [Planctomycetota bacterium]